MGVFNQGWWCSALAVVVIVDFFFEGRVSISYSPLRPSPLVIHYHSWQCDFDHIQYHFTYQKKSNMTRFRPCIDLHSGQVKQIVGGTLDSTSSALKTNFVSEQPAAHYATLYKDNALEGGHVIMLGPNNDSAAKESLSAWPNGLQVGGGINEKNAAQWIEAGASKVSNTASRSSYAWRANKCHRLLLHPFYFLGVNLVSLG